MILQICVYLAIEYSETFFDLPVGPLAGLVCVHHLGQLFIVLYLEVMALSLSFIQVVLRTLVSGPLVVQQPTELDYL